METLATVNISGSTLVAQFSGDYYESVADAVRIERQSSSNTPPVVTNSGAEVSEDTALDFTATDFTSHFSDADTGDTLVTVKITGLPSHGTLKLDGVAVSVNEEIALADLGDVTYQGNQNVQRERQFPVEGQRRGGVFDQCGHGVDHDRRGGRLAGGDQQREGGSQNAVLEFTATAFTSHFSDADTGETLKTVKITSLPSHGTLKLDSVAVDVNDEIALEDLGDLTYQGASGYVGSDSFQWKASDQVAYSEEAATVSITVVEPNHSPSFTKGDDQEVDEDAGAQTVEDWATEMSPGPTNESGQELEFQIVSNSNEDLFSVGPAVDSSTGDLTYTPAANANGVATIHLVLVDDGRTAYGGEDTSDEAVFTITVNSVNDSPSGTNNTVTTLEDTAYTLAAEDFGFTDPNDSPANNFNRVKITTLPTAGTLKLDGVAVSAGQFVTVADVRRTSLRSSRQPMGAAVRTRASRSRWRTTAERPTAG